MLFVSIKLSSSLAIFLKNNAFLINLYFYYMKYLNKKEEEEERENLTVKTGFSNR